MEHWKKIDCEADQVRLDLYLSQISDLSRTRAAELIESGGVLVNGKEKAKNYKLSCGDSVEYMIPEDEEIDTIPQDLPLDIVFEDEQIIVVNKAQGMVVHPAPGNPDGTLVNALLYHCRGSLSGINGKLRPGIVHRIDKDTSGLLIVAKTNTAHTALSEMFQSHNFVRKYEAIVYGNLKAEEGIVDLAIGRSKKDRKKMAFFPNGTPNTKNAVTHFKVLERFDGYTRVELTLETGRTHQIRVHMLSLSSPVLADPLYAPGRKNFGLGGQCLHAKHIKFKHPTKEEVLSFTAPLPDYFENTLQLLRKQYGKI